VSVAFRRKRSFTPRSLSPFERPQSSRLLCDLRDHARRGRRTSAWPRTHASRHTTLTTGSSRPCDRRPARDRVGDPRCCSRWGCNSGPERKPAYEAIVGAGRQPSLLSGISDRQLSVDGAVRMPRTQPSCRGRPDDCIARMMRKSNRARSTSDAALWLIGHPGSCLDRRRALT
jgi:hypothetical protein